MTIVGKLLGARVGRYIIIGGSVYVLELVVITVVQALTGSPLLAVGLSFWIGLITSFLLQKFFTFEDKRTRRQILLPQIVAYCALVLFNFGFTLLVTKILVAYMPTVLTRTIALGITTLWNYYLYKTRIFNVSDNPVY